MKTRGWMSSAGILQQPVVERDDVEQVQVLALVFVQALDLHVEERVGADRRRRSQFLDDARRARTLLRALDGAEALLELRVVGEALQLAQLVAVPRPAVADGLGDERGQLADCRP